MPVSAVATTGPVDPEVAADAPASEPQAAVRARVPSARGTSAQDPRPRRNGVLAYTVGSSLGVGERGSGGGTVARDRLRGHHGGWTARIEEAPQSWDSSAARRLGSRRRRSGIGWGYDERDPAVWAAAGVPR